MAQRGRPPKDRTEPLVYRHRDIDPKYVRLLRDIEKTLLMLEKRNVKVA
jgi:hypothetical protein